MNINLFSLPNNCLVNIYLHLPNKESRLTFDRTNRTLHEAARLGEKCKKVCSYIQDNYTIHFRSPRLYHLEPLTILKVEAILIGENHMVENHRKINSALVDLLFNPVNTNLLTESGCDAQVIYASEKARKSTTTWDLDKSWTNVYRDKLMACYRNILACFELSENYKFECEKLEKELNQISEEFYAKVLEVSDSRNDSLCKHVRENVQSKQFPIVIAGNDHVTDIGIYTLFNIQDISGLSLVPKGSERENEWDLVAETCPELREYVVLHNLLKEVEGVEDKIDIIEKNWNLYQAMVANLRKINFEKPLPIHYVYTLHEPFEYILFVEKELFHTKPNSVNAS